MNQILRDGVPYETIISRLNELAHPGVLKKNLSNWRKGGYQEWLTEQFRHKEIKLIGDFVLHQNECGKLPENAVCMAMARFVTSMNALEEPTWNRFMSEDPVKGMAVVKTLLQLSKEAIEGGEVQGREARGGHKSGSRDSRSRNRAFSTRRTSHQPVH